MCERQRVAIAVEADEPCRAMSEQGMRVTAESDGAVDEDTAMFGLQVLEHLRSHHGQVRHRMDRINTLSTSDNKPSTLEVRAATAERPSG